MLSDRNRWLETASPADGKKGDATLTRKEMIETIAKEAGCSKRLVRKSLFNRSLELKKHCPRILFYKTFLDKNTNWVKFNEKPDWQTKNIFHVACFKHSGCVILFANIDELYDGEIVPGQCGAKLYNWKSKRYKLK